MDTAEFEDNGGGEDFVDAPDYSTGDDYQAEPESWAGPSQEEWAAQNEALTNLAAMVEQLTAEGQYGDEEYVDEGYADEEEVHPFQQVLQEMIEGEVEQRLQEQLQPFDNVLGSVAEQKGEEIANSELDRISQDLGGNFDRTQAVLIADSFVQQGYDPIPALEQAARMVYQYEQGLKQQAINEYRENLGRVAGAGEPGAGSSSAYDADKVPEGESAYRHAALRALRAGRRPGHPAG